MKKSRYSDRQAISILKQVATAVAELCREHAISTVSFYKWGANMVVWMPSWMANMKVIEAEMPA